jgi:RNA polymerase sigma-70 factor (ECF subfamily)
MFSVNREVYQNEMQQQVAAHMDRLPEAQRQAVGLNYFQGLSQREIATRLSLPLGTIKTRIELGMRKLGRSMVSVQAA